MPHRKPHDGIGKVLAATKRPIVYRVKFVYDDDARFEECNGESRPLTVDEYTENPYRACPQHWRAGSRVVTAATKSKPAIVGCAVCGNTAYENIPYVEYLAYYGNPELHVYLGCIVERSCACCGLYKTAASVWAIGFMRTDDRAWDAIDVDRWLTEDIAVTLPDYAGEIVRELLDEARPS